MTKPEKKTVKSSKKEAELAVEESTKNAVNEDADEDEESEGNGQATSGNAAALAAATGGTQEMSASFKNFRHHPDMENFYRFIFENDLRHEALAIIDEIIVDKQNRKAKTAKS